MLTLRDRLSHLSFDEACRVLGRGGKIVLLRGGELELPYPEALRIDDRAVTIAWEPGPGGVSSRLFLDPAVPGGLRAECSDCSQGCEHIGGLLSILLERKTDLGLAVAPLSIRPDSDEKLVEQAIAERAERARKERMTVRSSDRTTPWTDYEVTSAITGKTYRVALRGEVRGESYCACPDFKTSTLGTCKHIMKVLARTRSFSSAVRRKPYRRRRITVHVRYDAGPSLALALPAELSPDAERIVRPLVARPIEPKALLAALQRLEAGGHAFFVTPDAEELVERKLLAERMKDLVAAIRSAPARHALRTSLLRVPLLPYQLDGIAFAAGAGRAILADEMGLGKTIQGVGVAELLARELGIKKVLVVCPASLKAQWRSEIRQFSGRSVDVVTGTSEDRAAAYGGDAFFSICNYEQVLRDIVSIEAVRWDLVILDEGQRIKNWEAKTSRVVKALVSRFALVLTGTPLENRLADLHSVVAFVDPHRLGPSFRFLHRHERRDERGKLLGFKSLEEVRERLRPILLRRTHDSVRLELPPRTVEIVRIVPTEEQKVVHDGHMRIVASIVRKPYFTEMDLLRLRAALLMCRLAANSTVLVDKQPPGSSSKLERLAEIFDDIAAEPTRKVVLFSEWTKMLDLIEPLLKARKLGFVRLDGSVPQKTRQSLVSRFQNDENVRFFLTTNAGSTGLNLQSANTVVNVDLPWNPAVLEQRIARAHRMGQKRPVSVFVLVTEQTLEENLLGTLSTKRDLASAALDPDSQVSDVDVVTQADDIKSKLEILLGSKPQVAPAQPKPAALGGTETVSSFLRAALELVEKLEAPELAAIRTALDMKTTTDERGERRLSLALPTPGGLSNMLRTLADALEGAAPTTAAR